MVPDFGRRLLMRVLQREWPSNQYGDPRHERENAPDHEDVVAQEQPRTGERRDYRREREKRRRYAIHQLHRVPAVFMRENHGEDREPRERAADPPAHDAQRRVREPSDSAEIGRDAAALGRTGGFMRYRWILVFHK